MVDYPFKSMPVADPHTFARAANAEVTIYAATDTANATPLALKDPSGIPLPNPLTTTALAYLPPFITTVPDIKFVGGGLTVFESSPEGLRNAADAAQSAAETAQADAEQAVGNTVASAAVDGAGKLILTKQSGATVDAGPVIGPAGPAGPKGADGSNVLPTDTAIRDALVTPGTATRGALDKALARNPLTIALIGDSITNQNSDGPNASTVYYTAAGYWTWANILLRQRFSIVTPNGAATGEFGGSGKTSAQILNDDAPAWAASAAKWGIVLAGTNDIPTRTASAIAADLLAIWRLGTAAGKTVVACTITPRGVTADTEAMRETLRETNRLIRANAQTEPGVILCDLYSSLVDPATGKMQAAFGAAGDGTSPLHPNGQGAIRMGKIIADTLNSVTPGSRGNLPQDAVDTRGLLPNPFMTGDTSGGATSTNFYTLGAGVHTKSKVARTDGVAGDWQQVAVTSAPAPNTDGVHIQQQTLAVGTDWNVGDSVYAVLEFETDATNWAVRHMRMSLNFFGGGAEAAGLRNDSGERTAATVPLVRPERGIIRTPVAVIPTGTTRLQMDFQIYGVGTVRVSRFDIIKA